MKHSIFAHNFRNVITILDIFLSIAFKSCMYNTDLYMHVSSLWTVHFFYVCEKWMERQDHEGGFFWGGGIVLVEVCVRVCVSIIHDKRASVCMFFVCAVTMRKP